MSNVTINLDGKPIAARAGESLAAALVGAGVRTFRQTHNGARRGIFCGMGVCQDCLVEIDGETNQRACMAKVVDGMRVSLTCTSRRKTEPAGPPITITDIPVEQPEILVIGAGPAGLSAAIAARRAGAQVLILDERKLPGGQYFKQLSVDAGPKSDRQHREGRRLIEEALGLGVAIRSDALVWGAFEPLELAASVAGGTLRLQPQRLVIATGAYERVPPFPGWTLPGVMTTGAAQTLWRTARRLPGQRVLVAGNGPLNLQVAVELLDGGADIVAVVETAASPGAKDLGVLARMAADAPLLFADGLRYRAKLRAHGVPLIHGAVVKRAERRNDALTADVGRRDLTGAVQSFDVDAVCLGYGFLPSNEIARALGVVHDFDARRGYLVVRRDQSGQTSIREVFAVGDCAGLGGARVALAEGTIAGFAAAKSLGYTLSPEAERRLVKAHNQRARHRRFQSALWTLFAAPPLRLELARRDTLICRCEEVTLGAIDEALSEGYATAGNVKRRTRAGMGPCQGRYCGPLIDGLVAERCGFPQDEFSGFAPRMPLKPIVIADLVRGVKL
jgi:thioredoxin reductase